MPHCIDIDGYLQIQYAYQHNVSFLATGGGHGYSISLSQIQGGIEMDLSNFKEIQVDAQANKLTVGGAVRFRDVTGALQAAGKEIRKFTWTG